MYDEDCMDWLHGPVYEMFKTFKYNPIDDNRFVMFKNRFQELSKEEKGAIKKYFEGVSEQYDIKNVDGIKKYINKQLEIA